MRRGRLSRSSWIAQSARGRIHGARAGRVVRGLACLRRHRRESPDRRRALSCIGESAHERLAVGEPEELAGKAAMVDVRGEGAGDPVRLPAPRSIARRPWRPIHCYSTRCWAARYPDPRKLSPGPAYEETLPPRHQGRFGMLAHLALALLQATSAPAPLRRRPKHRLSAIRVPGDHRDKKPPKRIAVTPSISRRHSATRRRAPSSGSPARRAPGRTRRSARTTPRPISASRRASASRSSAAIVSPSAASRRRGFAGAAASARTSTSPGRAPSSRSPASRRTPRSTATSRPFRTTRAARRSGSARA